MLLSLLGLTAVLSFGIDIATAQTPTQTWTPGQAVCSLGLPTPTAQNGTYIDRYNANWAVQCGQDSTGFWYDNLGGTLGQGVYACFKGCDSRPGCTAFAYIGTVTGATSGSGRCYYKFNAGSYYTNSTVYAAANLISNGTPNLVCPYYNGTTYTAADGSTWQILCGFDSTATPASTGSGAVGSMAQCMTQCNAISDCSLFTYTYTGAEPADGAANTDGTCYFKKGSPLQYAAPTVGFAQRIATAGAPIPTSSTVTSTAVLATSTVALTSTVASTSSGALAGIGGVVSTPVAGVLSSSLISAGSSSLLALSSTALGNAAPSTTLNIATTTSGTTTSLLVNVGSPTPVSSASALTLSIGSSTLQGVISSTLLVVSSPSVISLSSSSLVGVATTPVVSAASPTLGNALTSTTLAGLSSTGLLNTVSTLTVNVLTSSLTPLISTTAVLQTTAVSISSQALNIPATTQSTAASSTATTLACTSAPIPSTPVCPAANATTFLDTCGQNYTVYCGFDSLPGAVSSQPASSILQCSQLCDNYSGCVSAIYVVGSPGACYFKTAFTSLTSNSAVVALVRNAPPNPSIPPPLSANSVNASTGCGQALPAGLTPNGASVLFNFINPTDGLQRNYTVHIPQYYDPNRASPVIFAFPGNGESASNIEQETGLSNGAVNPYAIVVYVNGYGLGFASNPNWGVPGSKYSFVDDLGFIKNLVANMTASFCVDTSKIWATGQSNGGGFVNVLACDPVLSGVFSAFVASSAAAYTNATSGDPGTLEPVNTPIQAVCSPSRLIPFLEIHGTADATINYYGGPRNGRILPSIPHFITDWAIRNGLGATNTTTALNSLTTQYQFGGGAGLGLVSQLTLSGWGHYWPTIAGGAPIDGAPVALNFFYNWYNASRLASNISAVTSTASASATSISNLFSIPLTSLTLTSVSVPSTTLGLTISNTTALTAPLTASISLTVATLSSTGISVTGVPSAVSVSAGVSVTLGATVSLSPTLPSTSISGLTINATNTLSLPTANTTLSISTPSISLPSTSFGLASTTVSTSTLTFSIPTISTSIATPSLLSISLRSLSTFPITVSIPSTSVTLPSTSLSVFSTSLAFSSLSVPPTTATVPGFTISSPTVSSVSPLSYTAGSPSISVPGISFSTGLIQPPSTSASVPVLSTSISVISTFYSLFSTSLAVPSTSLTGPSASLGFSIPSASSATGVVSSVGASSSASAPAVPLSTVPPSYACPYNNGSIVNSQNGVTYIIQCGSDTSGQNSGIVSAAASFNDCFYSCDATTGCLGFTYSGSSSGQGSGPGLCFLKSGPVGFTSGSANVVAVVRYTGPFTASYAPTVAGSTSVGLSTSIQSSSPGVSISSTSTSIALLSSTIPVLSTPGIGLPTLSSTPAVSSVSIFPLSVSSIGVSPSFVPTVSAPTTSVNIGSVTTPSASFPSVAVSVGVGSTVVSPPAVSSVPISSAAVSVPSTSTGIVLPSNSLTIGQTASISIPTVSAPFSLPAGGSISSPGFSTTTTTSSSTTATDPGTSVTASSVQSSGLALPSSLPLVTPSAQLTITSVSASVVSTTLPSTTILPPCPTNACGVTVAQPQNNQTCQDAFGNHFAVSCGVKVTGAVAIRLTKPDSGSCLQACDTATVCVAINFDSNNGACELLSSVNGTEPASPNAAAARRPADVYTVYTAYPTTTYTTSSLMTNAAATTSAGQPGYPVQSSVSLPGSFVQQASSSSGQPVYGIGISTPAVTTSRLPPGGAYGPTSVSSIVTPGGGSSGSPGQYGSATSKAPSATTSSAQYTGPICPNYDGLYFTDAQSNIYSVQCNSAYQGVQIPGNYKRAPGVAPNAQYCMAACDQINACVAVTYAQQQCQLYSSVSGTIPSYGSAALYRSGRLPASVSVITVSTCASTGVYTYTQYTTVDVTTTMMCSAPAVCTTATPAIYYTY